MKRGPILTPIMGIFLIGLVSAFNLNYGYYFDDTTIALVALFLLFFAAINFILGKTAFGRNTATRTIMALAISIIAVYGISNTNFSVGGGSFGHWYIGDYLPTILTGIIIAGTAYLLYKFRIARVLIGTGIILMILSQTNWIYEKSVVLITGILLTIIGLFLLFKYKRRIREPRERDHSPNPTSPKSKYSRNRLIQLAKKFKRWARSQKNPRFSGSWAMFVNKLYKWGYGKNEAEIINNFGVTQKDFLKIFNHYGKV